MSVPEIGFIPRIGAVAIGADRFDLTSSDLDLQWHRLVGPHGHGDLLRAVKLRV